LEKRIQKLEDLSMLIERWRKLTKTRQNLQTFSMDADGFVGDLLLAPYRINGEYHFCFFEKQIHKMLTEKINN